MGNDTNSSGEVQYRAVHLVLVGVIGLSFVGFFIGIRQGTPTPEFTPRDRLSAEQFADSIPAMSYAEFDRRRFGPNRRWRVSVNDFDKIVAPPPEFRWMSVESFQRYLRERDQRRAFDGAPPTVPHPIEQMSVAECLTCHVQAQYVGKYIYAPAMSHELMPNCTQCHIEQTSAVFDSFLIVENTFEGVVRPQAGFRAWSAAPPHVPHDLNMRENCLSCHGPAGAQAIRTAHPWDAVCLQCHIPANMHEQFARPEVLRRLGYLDSIVDEFNTNDNADHQ